MQEHLQRRPVLALWLVAVIFVRPSQPQPSAGTEKKYKKVKNKIFPGQHEQGKDSQTVFPHG
jgi:hypothetical protein